MKPIRHKQLAGGRWFELSFVEQMANIGADVGRAISWRTKGNVTYSNHAVERALELIGLTILDEKNRSRLKELCRVRELLIDHFLLDNEYQSTEEGWEKYFHPFTWAARAKPRKDPAP
jgi:hypothetical protein